MNGLNHDLNEASRREFLVQGGAGFGALALTGMLAQDTSYAALRDPKVQRKPHFAPTAKRVIFLFMEGGPSHMDLFDPKPLINQLAGQRMPASFKRPITAMGETESPILASQRQWKQHGQSGLWVSDWLPHTAKCVDDQRYQSQRRRVPNEFRATSWWTAQSGCMGKLRSRH